MTKPTELCVGGQTYRVRTSASAEELERLAGIVNEKLSLVHRPGQPIRPEMMLLAAISLAHDLEAAQARERVLIERSRAAVSGALARVTSALQRTEESLARTEKAK